MSAVSGHPVTLEITCSGTPCRSRADTPGTSASSHLRRLSAAPCGRDLGPHPLLEAHLFQDNNTPETTDPDETSPSWRSEAVSCLRIGHYDGNPPATTNFGADPALLDVIPERLRNRPRGDGPVWNDRRRSCRTTSLVLSVLSPTFPPRLH